MSVMPNDLYKYDIKIAVDKSGSMSRKDGETNSRWERVKESTIGLANAVSKFDDDGISILLFGSSVQAWENVDASKIEQIFDENEPQGDTNTHLMLNKVFDDYFSSKKANGEKAKPVILLVVTDGSPTDKNAVVNSIVNATKKMDRDEELGVLFLQVGNDDGAAQFLQFLDDDLVSKYGAKFDIVDTKTVKQAGDMSYVDLLLGALND